MNNIKRNFGMYKTLENEKILEKEIKLTEKKEDNYIPDLQKDYVYCPKCDRGNIQGYGNSYGCLWRDCHWTGSREELIDYQKKKHEDLIENGTSFPEFEKYLEKKMKRIREDGTIIDDYL